MAVIGKERSTYTQKATMEGTEIIPISGTEYITPTQITAGKQNTLTFDTAPTADSINPVTSGGLYTALGLKVDTSALTSHTSNTSNPHSVTKAQIGLGNVDNTADLAKPISTATQTALDAKVDKVSGKGLSTNDYTTTEQTKLSGIEAGAQANVLESVKLGGTALSITNKAVNIPLDTTATSGSTNPITSGAVYTALGDISTALTTINGE